MDKATSPKKLPLFFAAGSLVWILILTLVTNPLNHVLYAMAFFLAFSVFLIALGYLLTLLHRTEVTPKAKFKIYVISIFITLLIMFRSAGALGIVDAVVLTLITLGLLFYGSRRA